MQKLALIGLPSSYTMIYLFIFILLAFFSFLELINFSKKKLINLQIFVGIIFVFIAGLRYETGVDWKAYSWSFYELPALDKAYSNNQLDQIFETLDVGYYLFNSIVKMLGGGIQVVFFCISLASSILLIKNLRYYSNYVLTGLLVYYTFYFFVLDLSGIRQGLALQIFLFSLKYIGQKKFLKFLLIILIATSIHWSSLLLLPLYFFIRNDSSKKLTIALFLISAFVFTFQIKWLGSILGDLIFQLNFASKIAEKVDAYTSIEIYATVRKWDLYSIFNFLRLSLVAFFCIKHKVILTEKVKYFNLFYNLILIELFAFFCLYEFIEISERLRFYFLISEIILISNIIFSFKSSLFKQIYFMLFLIIFFLNSYPFLLNSQSTVAYHPYQNYWVHKVLNLRSDGDERLEEHKRTHE